MADEAAEPKKKSPLKWIILLVILLLVGGGGYFAYTKFMAAPAEDAASADEEPIEEAEVTEDGAPKPKGPTQIITLPTFLVNLADPLGRRYLKLTVDVEVDGEKAAEKLNTNMAKVKDALILLLSSKSYADLASLENKKLLKLEIVNELNMKLGGADVLHVYFTDMVIQ